MRTGGLFQFMRFVCNLPRIMRLFDFGRKYAKATKALVLMPYQMKFSKFWLHLWRTHCALYSTFPTPPAYFLIVGRSLRSRPSTSVKAPDHKPQTIVQYLFSAPFQKYVKRYFTTSCIATFHHALALPNLAFGATTQPLTN